MALLLSTAVPGCRETAPSVVPLPAPTVLPSPTDEGSGEPHLSPGKDGVHLSWLQDQGDGTWALETATYRPGRGGWSTPRIVTRGDSLFVNWADFPSVVKVGDRLVAHWLQRGAQGGYDYGIRVRTSDDGGAEWSEVWIPHDDHTPTEHGFVSIFPVEEGAGLVWLDGRRFVAGPDGAEPTEEMTLRFRTLDAAGRPGAGESIDARVCDCCQTDAALTSRGPVVVYRNRSPEEVRDIYVTRRIDGHWTEGRPVHRDGWTMPACPVNGPAVSARGETLAVAWFTGAGDAPRVKVALSHDAGAAFDAPVAIDDGDPAGRVDVVLLADGSAAVSWLERTEAGGAEIRVRRVHPGGALSPSTTVSTSSAARASGFPQMVEGPDGALVIAWTDVGGSAPTVRLARIRPGPTS